MSERARARVIYVYRKVIPFAPTLDVYVAKVCKSSAVHERGISAPYPLIDGIIIDNEWK